MIIALVVGIEDPSVVEGVKAQAARLLREVELPVELDVFSFDTLQKVVGLDPATTA